MGSMSSDEDDTNDGNGSGADTSENTTGTTETEGQTLTEIEDEDVPLGVLEDEDLVDLEDEDVPLAAGVKMNGSEDGLNVKPWYWWILAVVAAITGKTVYDKKKKAMEAAKEAEIVTEEVTEDEEK